MLLATLVLFQTPTFSFEIWPQAGLKLSVAGIPVVKGSWFQYFEPDWSKGYYSSTYNNQTVVKVDANTVSLTFGDASSQVFGSQRYQQVGNRLKVHYEFGWRGTNPVKVELCGAMISAAALEYGQLTLDGKPTRDLRHAEYKDGEIGPRRFGDDAKSLSFASPLAKFSVAVSTPLTIFDARKNYPQDWAEGKDLWWMGALNLTVEPGKTTVLDLEYVIDPAPVKAATAVKITTPVRPLGVAQRPLEGAPVLIPAAERNHMNFERPIELSSKFTYPAGMFDHAETFERALANRFLPANSQATPIAFDGGTSKMGLRSGGYKIVIEPGRVSVLGEDDEGVVNGLYRLAQMVFVKDGKLCLPTGYMLDQPGVTWRGVHLFVGPKARVFHEKLWNRVLRPLGFNKVVLQCERTDWKSQPKIKTDITMPREELIKTFAMYRGLGVEPIPLIQSFGHMEWLFANGQNREIALNPDALYAVDPRKAGTWKALNQIWAEAISVLKPETIHFGLDEVNMRGWPEDPALVTDLWKQQVNFLGDLAKFHKVKPMLWGDMMLGPKEGPDAMNGDTLAEAAKRRAAVPKGSIIADWHYLADPDPKRFKPVLDLWKTSGMRPIASAWYRPENIRGFNTAANLLGVGTLQTTWCGYESNEEGMIAALNQFSAMVLAADYAWSGRPELPEKLPYDPTVVLRRMMFDGPQSVSTTGGFGLGGSTGQAFTIEGVSFLAMTPVELLSTVTDSTVASVKELEISGLGLPSVPVAKIALALDTRLTADAGEVVGRLGIETSAGLTTRNIVYGRDVRSEKDSKATALTPREKGLSRFLVDLGPMAGKVIRITLKPVSNYAGLRLSGVTFLNSSAKG